MNSDHTNISPSQAERFFNCPGSVQAQAKIDLIEPSSPAALEGTAIHELAAKCMKQDIDPYDMIGETIEVKDNFGETIEFTVNDDFAFTVRMYRNTILGILGQHGLTQKALNIEAKCKIPEIDKYAKGTVDCSFIAGSTLYVFDLKGGRGVIVSPEENKQCMYYALRPFFDARMFIDRVVIGIIQPRAKEGDYIKMWETTPERLDAFAKELKDTIAKTRVKNPEFKAGDHCRWCKAEGNCPVVMDMMVAQVQAIAPSIESAFPKVTELTPEQIGNALPALEALKGILDTLQGYALSLASKGIDIPNYALTKGRKLRRYKDEQSVIDAFGEEMGEQLYETKLRTPAQLEKLVGKERLEDYVFTPEGDLKLVPTNEAKEFISRTVEQVFKDVKIEQLTEGE